MDASVIFSQMLQMFLMIFLGYVLRKIGMMDQNFTSKLTNLVLNVAIPCLIINSVIGSEAERDLAAAGQVFVIAIAFYLLMPVLALLICKLVRLPRQQQGLYAFMTTFSNVGFMGFPLVNAIFGSDAVFYAAIYNIIFNLSAFTVGVVLMHYGRGERASLDPKLLLTPGVLLSVVAVVLYVVDFQAPSALISFTESVGSINTPCAMLCLGSTLASMPLREVVGDRRIYVFSLLKQIALPLALLPLLNWAVSDSYLRSITYLLMLTPVANSAVLFATKYGADEKLAARGVFVSTVLSVATLPLLGSLAI